MAEKKTDSLFSEAGVAEENGDGALATIARRKIPGNLPYTSSAGVLKSVLSKIPASERPAVFSADFLATVLGASGGASRPVIPILKATGLLNQSGAPTELYAAFQTENGRPKAALQALKNGFQEIFRRNQYAHKLENDDLTDLIVSVTGLPKNERVVGYIRNTFQLFQEIARTARDEPATPAKSESITESSQPASTAKEKAINGTEIGLVYNINIVLPETTNIEVYNAIFRSLKANLI